MMTVMMMMIIITIITIHSLIQTAHFSLVLLLKLDLDKKELTNVKDKKNIIVDHMGENCNAFALTRK